MWTRRFTIWVNLIFLATWSQNAHAQLDTLIFKGQPIAYIGESVKLISVDQEADVSEFSKLLEQAQPCLAVPNLGISHKHHYLFFAVQNQSEFAKVAVNTAFPSIDRFEVFEKLALNDYHSALVSGQRFPFSTRENSFRDFVYESEIPFGRTKFFVLHVESGEQMLMPIIIESREDVVTNTATQDIFFGIYFGIIMVMFFYNLFVFFSIGDLSYLLYVIYILSIGLAQTVLQGYAFRFFWPESSFMAVHDTYLFGALSGITALVFARHFLKIRSISSGLDNFLLALIGIDILAGLLSLIGWYNISYNMINTIAALGSLSLLFIAYHIGFRKKVREARFFLFAWSFFLMAVIVYVLKDVNIVPYNDLTDGVLMMGSGIEAVLLSLALADRINILKKQTAEAQKNELLALRANERLVTEQNLVLEQRVNERTVALKEANTQLAAALQDLKSAQVQLVNAEKLASLGQLTAGIAHEINNPINFVAASVIPLRQDFSDLETLIERYDLRLKELLEKEEVGEFDKIKKDLDIDYCLNEIKELINGVEEGAQRTAEIVQGLKNFSRIDESESNQANVHDLLDSTLIVLRNLTKKNTTVTKHYASNMEAIKCFPGKLNQVFSNIIVNAVHATQDKSDAEILISTEIHPNDVVIKIADNGTGIPDEIKSKIFDPFFTTKDVGEGTGLGLSIVYSIINQHNGQLDVETEMGKGTTFVITLPKE